MTKNPNLHYRPCPACGVSFGRGKGAFGLGRHGCDERARWIARFFKAGVDLNTCAAAAGVSYEQAELLLREVMGGRS